MIFICGIPSEPPIRLLCTRLEDLKVPFVMYNQRHFTNTSVSYRLCGSEIEGTFSYHENVYDISGFSGYYTRMTDDISLPELKKLGTGSAEYERSVSLNRKISDLMEIVSCRVINKHSAMASNNSKPYQAQFIKENGFKIPETVITNDPDRVMDFISEHKEVIFKSISGVRSIVKKITENDIKRIAKIRNCPVQFQRCVPGFDVRVHVIGELAIATKIISNGTDYRYVNKDENEDTILEPYELETNIYKNCVDLTKALGLEFSGIDLRIDGSDVYCFEVNPSPGYSYYESNTGQMISCYLAEYISNHDNYYKRRYNLM
jgi:hypothetical protein